MPIYEFRCAKCKTLFEELCSSTAKMPCPQCGSRKTERQFSVFGMGGSTRGSKSSCSSCARGSCAGCH